MTWLSAGGSLTVHWVKPVSPVTDLRVLTFGPSSLPAIVTTNTPLFVMRRLEATSPPKSDVHSFLPSCERASSLPPRKPTKIRSLSDASSAPAPSSVVYDQHLVKLNSSAALTWPRAVSPSAQRK